MLLRLFLPLALLFSACDPTVTKSKATKFFDMKGLMIEQINLLDSLNPLLQKVAQLDNEIDTVVFRPDSTSWARELSILAELDINRRELWDRYDEVIEQAENGNESLKYVLLEGENENVTLLNIIRQNGQLKQIVAEYNDKSTLYDAFRNINIVFEPEQERTRIINYSINGRQKIILKDTTFFEVKGEIIY